MEKSSPTKPFARIAGIGSCLPEKVMTNHDLEGSLETTDEWIVSHTGIRERHVVVEGQNCSDLGVEAARRALDDAGVSAEELGLVICTTCSGDYANLPTTACLIQGALGAVHAGAVELNSACTGFPYALGLARGYCVEHQTPVLVVAAEVISRLLDWSDRSTCILFGDGAGAVVLTPSETPGLVDEVLGADGTGGGVLIRQEGTRFPRQGNAGPHFIEMNGKAIFPFAVRIMERVIRDLLERNHLQLDEVQHVVPHQANRRIIEAVARHMEVPLERFFLNIEHVANISSASVPVALDELYRSGAIRKGDRILTVGFGAGLTFGGNLLVWDK
ncbi:MAG: ketoacyl-ACP synthase III [Victivallales bacterium]|nr:ketoacyl-ACP synthase III [Victivallales bacterium]